MFLVWAALLSGAVHTAVWGSTAHASVPPDVAPVDITWGIQPASSGDSATRAAFTYELDPGAVIDDAVRITNFSEAPLTLRVSAHDAFNTDSGGFDVVTSEVTSVDVGSWVTLDVGEVTVPARGSVDVPFRTSVPSNASPGDHAGGIVASMRVDGVDADGNKVSIDNRVGTRMYVRVTGPARPALAVTSLSIDFEGSGVIGVDGTAVVSFAVRNTGNLRLSAMPTVTVTGPFGIGERRVDLGAMPELLPGGEFSTKVRVDARRLGRLNAELTLVPTVPILGPIETSTSSWAIPWRVLAAVAIGVAFLLYRRRRPRGMNVPPSAASPTVLAGSLALAMLVPSTLQPVSMSVSLDRSSAAVGDRVAVDLAGWSQGVAQLEICGNAAARGTSDCDVLSGAAVAVGPEGTAAAALTITRPPVPCPCVVRVSQAATGAVVAVPFTVAGADVGATGSSGSGAGGLPAAKVRRVEVLDASLVADEGVAAGFGFDVRRRLVVTVRNNGTVPLTGVAVSAELAGGGTSSQPLPAPRAFDLAPGEVAQVALDVELATPAFGDYRVVGRVEGGDEPVEFSAHTSHMPWGLVNGGVLGVAIVWSRRRR